MSTPGAGAGPARQRLRLHRQTPDRGGPSARPALVVPAGRGEPGGRWDGPVGQGPAGRPGRRLAGPAGREGGGNDLLHVHSGGVVQHTRLVPRRFVVHLHGTDIRTLQYDPTWQSTIDRALDGALAVFYSTPGPGRAHPAPPARRDLPPGADRRRRRCRRRLPAPGPPVVFIASRWESVKGLRRPARDGPAAGPALADRARVVGLDWGPAADQAAAAGVELVPTRPHPAYLRLLAGATVVLGQAGGILSASELEAIGIGVPVVVPGATPLVRRRAAAGPGRLAGVGGRGRGRRRRRLAARRTPTAARDWVRAHHSPAHGVDLVTAVYDRLAASGWERAG